MIRFTVEGVKHEFDEGKYSNLELLDLKRVTTEHWSIKEFLEAFTDNDAEALTILVWFALRREGETSLKFSDVEFDVIEFMNSYEEDVEDDSPSEVEETDGEADPTPQPEPEPDDETVTPST